MNTRQSVILAGVVTALCATAPASAAATACGSVSGVGNGTRVTNVTTSSGGCTAAKLVAKRYARTRVAPAGYSCTGPVRMGSGAPSARVTCRRAGRTIRFKVVWTGAMPLPAAPALPSAGAG